jgi:hypothetical protein
MCQRQYQSHMKGSRVSKSTPGVSDDGRQSLMPSNSRFVRDAYVSALRTFSAPQPER